MRRYVPARIPAAALAVLLTSYGSVCAQDTEKGRQAFAACAACHTTNKENRAGPGLGGILGRESGAIEGFRYSRAMKNARLVWDERRLDDFITAPQKLIPGTIMPFSGIANAERRADLIAYLKTLK